MASKAIIKEQSFSSSLVKHANMRRKSKSSALLRIGFNSSNAIEIDREIRSRKVPLEVVARLGKELEISDQKAYELVHISSSTVSRRKKKGECLKDDEAGRVYRIASIIDLAELTLGERKRGVRWLKSPAKFLGGIFPLELLDTEAGTDEVRKLLLRIEHSVYS